MCVYEQNKALKSHLLYFPSHSETPHEKAAGLKSTGIIATWRGKKKTSRQKPFEIPGATLQDKPDNSVSVLY